MGFTEQQVTDESEAIPIFDAIVSDYSKIIAQGRGDDVIPAQKAKIVEPRNWNAKCTKKSKEQKPTSDEPCDSSVEQNPVDDIILSTPEASESRWRPWSNTQWIIVLFLLVLA